ncbi:helix-turn-helix domain-containing protein [Streptomyces sp. DSM 44917]|uniref:Helix-turn-helix domain-containing protein n=1 Tax=Streptomyces boetiae TaxID=3075541 RepID=A0ABU2L8L5_9ACTN|nr:helix-turn-helix domain-containing protein [Streptomyces sp. DSM 44917]MDT0307921.1 helix-turn-helix domain-containing protein [Streptomyces sp. DSM 44917]
MDEREARRGGYPLTIPDALLRSDAMRRACAVRDFGEIFRLVNRRSGTSLTAMAAAIGRISPSRISDVIHGARGIRREHVIERIADGLGIPGEMLGLPPRPWESAPTAADNPLPELNDERGDAFAESIRETSRTLIALDNALNGLPIADLAARAFKVVNRRLGKGVPDPRYERDIQAAAAELAEIAGWALFDAEEHEAAERFNQRALFLARLSGDRSIELLILQNMGMHAGWLGRPREEVSAARALLEGRRLSPRVEAIFHTREGRGLYALGQSKQGAAAFNRARSLLGESARADDPAWTWWITAPEIDGHEACELHKTGDWRRAIPLLLHSQGHPSVGYKSLYSARLLGSYLQGGAWREAEEVAEAIVPVAPEITSVRALNLLGGVARTGKALPGAPSRLRDTLDAIDTAVGADPYAL